jgi:hypothetical protein
LNISYTKLKITMAEMVFNKGARTAEPTPKVKLERRSFHL